MNKHAIFSTLVVSTTALLISSTAIAEDELIYNKTYNAKVNPDSEQVGSTSPAPAQAYELEEDNDDTYESAEIVAMKYSQSYALRFNEPYAVEEAMRGRTVFQKARPDYKARNIKLGAFVLSPQIGVAEMYNDNIFASKTGEVEDYVTRVKPVVVLSSNWSRHALSLAVATEAGFYQEQSDENYIDNQYSVNGKIDVLRDTFISLGFIAEKRHDDRSSAEDPNNAEPLEYALYRPSVGFTRKMNKITANVKLSGVMYDYALGESSLGLPVDTGDRDRSETIASAKLSYDFKPGYAAFLGFKYNNKEYARDAIARERDSDGYEVNVGTEIDLGGVTRGEAYVGYLSQDYSGATLDGVEAVNFGGNILWSFTKISTLQLNLKRTINETTLANASSFITTLGGVAVEHELRRFLLLRMGASYSESDYNGVDRKDELFSYNIGLKYLMNRNVSLNLDYNFQQRESDASASEFERNRVMFGLKAEL